MHCRFSLRILIPSVTLVLTLCASFSNVGFSQESLDNSLGMNFRRIPAGEFEMGFDHSGGFEELVVAFPFSITPRNVAGSERPRHRVRISQPFEMAQHEVTVGQFRTFCEATGYRTTAEESEAGMVGFAPVTPGQTAQTGKQRPFSRDALFDWKTPGFPQTDHHPVVGVSWEDANAFCQWLSERESMTYRLPTEAEWEYACRAGSKKWFSFGDSFRGEIHEHANIADVALEKSHPELAMRQWLIDVERDPADGFVCTAPVGSFENNRWELHDMHGNVWDMVPGSVSRRCVSSQNPGG